jgi:hypothetical protein
VIDVRANAILGLLDGKHIRGIAANGRHLAMHDRSIISTATHQVVGMLNFSEELLSNGFLVSPQGDRLYARDEVLHLPANELLPERSPVPMTTGEAPFSDAPVPGGPAISADGGTIFCGDSPVMRINTADNTATDTGITMFRLSDIGLTPDERVLAFSR